MKILFLAANPVDVIARLRVEQELREIEEKIHLGTHGQQLELVALLAVRTSDLQAALLRHEPDIVHFSGHCSQTNGIVLEDEQGKSKVISQKALSDLFSILSNVRVVVLNACYAKDQARALTETVDCAIGMNDAIEDKAALTFAAYFYQSLAFGRSVEEAFRLAKNQFEIEGMAGAQIPELLVRDGANPAEIRIGRLSGRSPEHADQAAAPGEPRSAMNEPMVTPRANPPLAPVSATSDAVLRNFASEALQRKSGWLVFQPSLLVSVAIILFAEVLCRFPGGDSSWPRIAAVVIQSVFTLMAAMALLLIGLSLLRRANPLVIKAARVVSFNQSPKLIGMIVLSAVVFLLALSLWLSLPLLAHYFNERGARFQFAEPPDLTRARESYQLAVRLSPSDAPAHYNLAIVQEDLQPETAMEEYRLAIRYDSHMYPAYNNLARLYLRRGQGNDYETAVSLLSQAVDLAPPDEDVQYSLNKNFGWASFLLKNYPTAEAYLRRAISLRDDKAAAHCLLAYVLKEQGKSGVSDECFDCVSLAAGEKDVETRWVSDAQNCLMKGGSQ